MGAGHDHGLGEVQHEKPLWWAFGLTAAFLVAAPFIVLCSVVGALVLNLFLTVNHRADRYIAM